MKGRSQMTSTVFGYDHIMMRAEYRTPDPHSHLAVQFIAGLDGPVHCVVSGDSFDADAVFIASDVVHTAYAETGDMLVFLFDTAALPKRRRSSICAADRTSVVTKKLSKSSARYGKTILLHRLTAL